MHASGFTLDLNWFFQFVATASFVVLGLLYLLKNTASKYFLVDTNFDSSESSVAAMPGVNGTSDHCVVCGNFTTKHCARCKIVRYCSEGCQKSHWNSGHKVKCKEFQLAGKLNLKGSRTSGAVQLIPAKGSPKTLNQLKRILFPYDEFVELFNWEMPGFPPCGLLNCGNSCFANVILQCLAHTRPLVAYFLKRGHRRECRRNDWCFLCELQTHVERARQSMDAFSPINILSRLPNIGGNLGYGKQEDAHEFMRFAIDTMQSVCLDECGGEKAVPPISQETTVIQHVFGGHLQSQVICTKCNNNSSQYENMMDLTVEIQGDAASLEECLDQFTAKESLHGENMYKCDGCNDYVLAWKHLTIHRAPNILTVALKRFQSGRFGKLNKRVTFPETLDLSPYMSIAGDGTDVYKLYAVVVHVDMLNASFFGHYICYTKDFSGRWYRVDDCKVIGVELDEVLSQGAYMLLYNRVHARESCVNPIGEISRKEEQESSVVSLPIPEQPVDSASQSAHLVYDTHSQSNLSISAEASFTIDSKEDQNLLKTTSDSKCMEIDGSDNRNSHDTKEPSSLEQHAHSSFSKPCSLTDGNSIENGHGVDESSDAGGVLINSCTLISHAATPNHITNGKSEIPTPCDGDLLSTSLNMNGEADEIASVKSRGMQCEVDSDKIALTSSVVKEAKKLNGTNTSSEKFKPLFPSGFLGQPQRHSTTKRDVNSTEEELGKVGPSFKLIPSQEIGTALLSEMAEESGDKPFDLTYGDSSLAIVANGRLTHNDAAEQKLSWNEESKQVIV